MLPLAVLPVTALARICHETSDFLLACTGNVLTAYGVQNERAKSQIHLPVRHSVHGIVALRDELESRPSLILYAGRNVLWVEVRFQRSGDGLLVPDLKFMCSAQAEDWILSGEASSTGSAILISSYNVLIEVKLDRDRSRLQCTSICNALSTFIYSATLRKLDENRWLVASGTAFGEVLTWLCVNKSEPGTWAAYPWRSFRGHLGSVFGIAISGRFSVAGVDHRLLASCSDDRTIRVWGLSILEATSVEVLERSHGGNDSVADEFVQTEQCLLTQWAHLSRIWHVDFSDCDIASDSPSLLMLSAGEDGQAVSWDMDASKLLSTQPSDARSIRNVDSDRHHSGKNIWSRCHTSCGNTTSFYTGGADGQIVSRTISHGPERSPQVLQIAQPFREIIIDDLDLNAASKNEQKPCFLKEYVMLGEGHLLGTNNCGRLLSCDPSQNYSTWCTIYQDSEHHLLLLAAKAANRLAIFINSSTHLLYAYDTTQSRAFELCSTRSSKVSFFDLTETNPTDGTVLLEVSITICYYDCTELDVVWVIPKNADPAPECTDVICISKSLVKLPATFEVTSSCYDHASRCLILGSRAGAIAVYTNIDSKTQNASPNLCQRHVHGTDTVTSITTLRNNESTTEASHPNFVTTGRDGYYCVFQITRVNSLEDGEQRTTTSRTFTLLHRLKPPFGPNIEGASLILQPCGTQKLLLHGFHYKQFVVWDETNQNYVMTVDCGGAHRNWTFKANETNGEGGAFIWTKAGTFMMHQQISPAHRVIQQGGHGREIKALAIHRLNLEKWVIATGSEDTDIRLFEYGSDVPGNSGWRNIAVLRKHTTGLQDLRFSDDGGKLLSTAGLEEMFAWRLSKVPVVGQGVVFTAALPRADGQSDARIMSFDLEPIKSEDSEVKSLMIVAAFSSGKFEKVIYSDDGHNASFRLLAQWDMGEICLTQAHILSTTAQRERESMIVIAATNGCIATRPFNENTNQITTKAAPTSSAKSLHQFNHQIHQNNISALQSILLTPSHNLLITGGDDSALALTLIHIPSTRSGPSFRTLVIPRAHAAALTALSVIDLKLDPSPLLPDSSTSTTTNRKDDNDKKRHIVLITAGNDQILRSWHVTISLHALLDSNNKNTPPPPTPLPNPSNNTTSSTAPDEMREIQIELLGEVYTNVADISAMELLHVDFEKRRAQVLVVGVGLESVDVDIDIESETEIGE